jgi:hypothetical protein
MRSIEEVRAFCKAQEQLLYYKAQAIKSAKEKLIIKGSRITMQHTLDFIDGKEDSVAIVCEPEAQHDKDES